MLARSTKLCAVLAVCIVLLACARPASEQGLRDTLDALQASAEQRRIGNFMDSVAEDFAGNAAEYDRVALERLLRLIVLRHQKIGVTRTSLDIDMHGERASVNMRILVTGGSGGLIPDRGQLFETTSTWRFTDGAWILTGANWKPL